MTDFDHAISFFPNWEGRFEQVSSGAFLGSIRLLRGSSVRLVHIEGNQRLALRGHDRSGVCSLYPVVPGTALSHWHGRQLKSGQVVVHGPQTETNHVTSKLTEGLGISLRPEALAEAIRLLRGVDCPSAPATWSVRSPSPEHFARLNRMINQLLNRGIADPGMLETAEGLQLEQECVRAVVNVLETQSAPEDSIPLLKRAQLVGQAEDIMRQRMKDPLGVIDLCRELGTSDRTLRLAFRERFGVGPMVYYRHIRLNAVRAHLRINMGCPIGPLAQRYGFQHLGHFAAYYRRLFGSLPSATAKE
jgi:AraC-like DNA-binding protein